MAQILRTTREIAEYLGVSRPTVAKYIEDGLPAGKVGRGWMVSTDLIDQWLITRHVDGMHQKTRLRALKRARRAAEQRLIEAREAGD